MNNLYVYDEEIEGLISAALADGVLKEKEKQVLFKRAQAKGIDLDEFEMVLDARLVELKKAEKAKTTTSAPKSNKFGDIRKCPTCGGMVPALAGVCPDCGYEFSGIDSNLSSQKLADLLLKFHSFGVERYKIIIETFPIPNTKSDLFEFLASIKPRMEDVKDPLAVSYFKKFEECINKAKISFPNDADLSYFIEYFEKNGKSLKRKQQRYLYKFFKGVFKAFKGFINWFTEVGDGVLLYSFLILLLIGLLIGLGFYMDGR